MIAASIPESLGALDLASARHETPNGDGKIVWRVWGEGPALMLLHGGSGSWMHWVRNIEALARDFTLLVPDMPGFGESDVPPLPYTSQTVAAPLVAGAAQILGETQHFSVAGFSLGGLISAHVARIGGARVDHLVLVGASGFGMRRGAMEPLKSWRRLTGEAERRAAHQRNLEILMLADPAKVDALAIDIQTYGATRARLRRKLIGEFDTLVTCLEQVSARVAGVWGEHDPTAAPYIGDRRDAIRAAHPDAPFRIIPGVGHWIMYEAPQALNACLREWVKAG